MKKIGVLFKKSILIALVTVFMLAVLPFTTVSASGLAEPPTPPSGFTQVSDERLEQIWVRMQEVYEWQGQRLEQADQMIERLQNIITRMNENGKDTTALQAALDAFEEALKDAHPIYESAKGIINSHKGFDAGGKVTDREQAVETVKELGSKMKDVRQLTSEPGKALREAFKAFRDAHRPADASGFEE